MYIPYTATRSLAHHASETAHRSLRCGHRVTRTAPHPAAISGSHCASLRRIHSSSCIVCSVSCRCPTTGAGSRCVSSTPFARATSHLCAASSASPRVDCDRTSGPTARRCSSTSRCTRTAPAASWTLCSPERARGSDIVDIDRDAPGAHLRSYTMRPKAPDRGHHRPHVHHRAHRRHCGTPQRGHHRDPDADHHHHCRSTHRPLRRVTPPTAPHRHPDGHPHPDHTLSGDPTTVRISGGAHSRLGAMCHRGTLRL